MPSHRGTAFRVAYYDSRCGAWWSLDGLMKHLRTNVELRAPQPHILRQVVWNSDVFTALSLIVLEVQQRRRAGLPEPVLTSGEPLVFVGFTLARLKAPFQLVLNGLLSWEPLLETFGIQGSGLEPGMVSVRLANDSTGPTFDYCHVVRHPRYRDTSAARWTNLEDLQMTGGQASENLQYIQLTRDSKDLTLWVHAEPLGSPGRPKAVDLESQAPKVKKNLLEHQRLIDLSRKYGHVDILCDQDGPTRFSIVRGEEQELGHGWWDRHWRPVKQAVDYYVYGAGQAELKGLILEKYIRQAHSELAVSMLWLPTSPLVQTSLSEAKRVRTQADPNMVPPPLLGRWAWPTDLSQAVYDCNIDKDNDLECMVWALGARIVNCLTIRPSSARFAVTAVPLLEPFPGLPEIPYSVNRDTWSANEPPEAITALV